MSLRRDIHLAFDGIEPSTFGLAERVVETVVSENATRRRNGNLMLRMRAPLSLVAVLVVVAVVAAALVGGRIAHEWNVFHFGSPAGSGTHVSLALLEARPLQLPHVSSTTQCPAGPVSNAGVYGNGPFYGDPALATGPTTTSWGIYWNLIGQTDRNQGGLLLVRAIDVKTQQPYVFVGDYAAGAVVGTDRLLGSTVTQRAELVLDTAHQPNGQRLGLTQWPFVIGVPNGNSGCYGYQIDGDTFTETFVFAV